MCIAHWYSLIEFFPTKLFRHFCEKIKLKGQSEKIKRVKILCYLSKEICFRRRYFDSRTIFSQKLRKSLVEINSIRLYQCAIFTQSSSKFTSCFTRVIRLFVSRKGPTHCAAATVHFIKFIFTVVLSAERHHQVDSTAQDLTENMLLDFAVLNVFPWRSLSFEKCVN